VNLNAVLDLQTVVDQLIHKIRVPEDLLPTGSPGAPLESGAVKGSWVAATRALLYISKIYIYRAVSALRSSSPSQENLGWELEFPNNVALRAEAAERAMAELKGTVTKVCNLQLREMGRILIDTLFIYQSGAFVVRRFTTPIKH